MNHAESESYAIDRLDTMTKAIIMNDQENKHDAD